MAQTATGASQVRSMYRNAQATASHVRENYLSYFPPFPSIGRERGVVSMALAQKVYPAWADPYCTSTYSYAGTNKSFRSLPALLVMVDGEGAKGREGRGKGGGNKAAETIDTY
jgi:hypothetical protein